MTDPESSKPTKHELWTRLHRDDHERVDSPDYDFGVKAIRVLELIARYFRTEIRGLERMPSGPALMVGTHNSGLSFLDPMFLGAAWFRRTKGTDDFVYLVHDAMLAVPGLSTYLRKMGAARASPTAADQAIRSGRKVLVYPGGNYEAFRPFKDRHKIDMGGHKGFCKTAIRHQVPIVPVVAVGSHETFFVLARGRRIARWTGLDRLLRVEAFPLMLSVPWGLSLGPIFHFPLPAKLTMSVGDPIPVSDFPPERASDPVALDELYQRVSRTMQTMMDDLARERRFPILG